MWLFCCIITSLRSCIPAFLTLGMFLSITWGANQEKISLELDNIILNKVYETIDMAIAKLKSMDGHEGGERYRTDPIDIAIRNLIGLKGDPREGTHYRLKVHSPTLTLWFIEKKVLYAYFAHPDNANLLVLALRDKFGQDLDKLKWSDLAETPDYHLPGTALYGDVLDTALQRISQTEPSSLSTFKSLDCKAEYSHNMFLGILRQGTTEQPCVYQADSLLFTTRLGEERFLRNLALRRGVSKGADVLFYYRLIGDEADYWRLGGTVTNPTSYADAICLYHLSPEYPSYTFIYSLIEPHPSSHGVSIGSILEYEPKLPQPVLKMLVKGLIQALLECHKVGVVYNADLVESVVVPTKALSTEPSALEGLRLCSFLDAFKMNGNEASSYGGPRPTSRPNPIYPPPEEIDKTLVMTEPTKFDAWYVGLVVLELHLGCRLFPDWGIDDSPLQAVYLTLFGGISMSRKAVMDRLKGLGYRTLQAVKRHHPLWYKFGKLKAGRSNNLWKLLEKNMDSDALNLAKGLLAYDPEKRMALTDTLRHRYFIGELGETYLGAGDEFSLTDFQSGLFD